MENLPSDNDALSNNQSLLIFNKEGKAIQYSGALTSLLSSSEQPFKDIFEFDQAENFPFDSYEKIATSVSYESYLKSIHDRYFTHTIFPTNLDNEDLYIDVIEDITYWKKSMPEINMVANKEYFLRGFDLATRAGGMSVWTWDMVQDEIEWSDSMYDLYGVDRNTKMEYQVWSNALHKEDKKRVEDKLRECLEKHSAWEDEFRILTKHNNEVKWIKAAADTILKHGKPVFMFGINQDISKEKKAIEALQKESDTAKSANAEKSRFLAMMSHEIRTPMNGIIGMLDLLHDTSLDQGQVKMIETISHSANSLLSVINDVLDFSKIESGQMTLDHISTSIIEVLEKAIDALWISVKQKNQNIYLNVDFSIPSRLLIDPIKLRQIILNLIGNAIKFTDEDNGKIFIEANLIQGQAPNADQQLELIVSDNGIGMSEDQIDKLFIPFTQADNSTTRKFGGTGLGLSITKSFVDLMGGEIMVESKANKGSKFIIRLPAHEVPEDNPTLYDANLDKLDVYIATEDQYDALILSNIYKQLNAIVRLIKPDQIQELSSDIKGQLVIIESDLYELNLANLQDLEDLNFLVLVREGFADEGFSTNVSFVNALPIKPSLIIERTLSLMKMVPKESSQNKENSGHSNFASVNKEDNSNNLELDRSSKKILFAEDQETNRSVLRLQAEKLNLNYKIVEDGQQAFDEWKSSEYDLILTDCNMPYLDGFELTKKIRALELEKKSENMIPIIAITANALTGDRDICLKSGMNDYISKPLVLNELRSKIDQYLFTNSETKYRREDTDSRNYINQNEIDLHSLYEVVGINDIESLKPLLSNYLETLAKSYKKLLISFKNRDSKNIKSIAHAAKGSSNSIGANGIAEVFNSIQKNPENFEDIKLSLGECKNRIERINKEIKALQ